MNASIVVQPQCKKRLNCLLNLLGCLVPVALFTTVAWGADEPKKSVYELSLEELANVRMASSASLTEVEPRKAPAQITCITRDDIRHSGARDLIDLLNIYIPGFQVERHPSRYRVWGTRGVDNPTKFVLLVNGRKMNDNYVTGAFPETILPMLGDIDSIEYVNGPGSALYGSGAIGGVINIKTRNPESVIPAGQKGGGTVRYTEGFINESSSMDLNYAARLAKDVTLGVYYGIGQLRGLSPSDSDVHAPQNYRGIPAGQALPGDLTPDNGATPYDNHILHKAMVELDAGNFKSWIRYTKAAADEIIPRNEVEALQSSNPHLGLIYRQFTWQNEGTVDISPDLILKLEGGYQDTYTAHKRLYLLETRGNDDNTTGESKQGFGRGTFYYDFNEDHHLAAGGEYIYERYNTINSITLMEPWNNAMEGLFAEYQGKLAKELTVFLGGRYDHDRYTQDGLSPRGAIIWTPTTEDTLKLSYNKSFRDIPAQNIGAYFAPKGVSANDETVQNLELMSLRQWTPDWETQVGGYWNNASFYGSQPVHNAPNTLIGKSHNWGASASIEYKTPSTRTGLAHCYDAVESFDPEPNISQSVYVVNPGTKLDYLHWSNHSTKLYSWVKVTDKFSINGNVSVLWYFHGMEEAYEALYNKSSGSPAGYRSQPGYDTNFGPSYSLNLGCSWDVTRNHTVRFDGYNLLALFDRDLNRLRCQSSLDYITMPASCALRYEYRF